MSEWIIVITALVLVIVWEFRSPCSCGRSARWYFFVSHPKARCFYFWAVGGTLLTFFDLFTMRDTGDAFVVFYIAMLTAYYWRRLWKHENGKIKRAARALGRVVIKDNGRLGIEPS